MNRILTFTATVSCLWLLSVDPAASLRAAETGAARANQSDSRTPDAFRNKQEAQQCAAAWPRS